MANKHIGSNFDDFITEEQIKNVISVLEEQNNILKAENEKLKNQLILEEELSSYWSKEFNLQQELLLKLEKENKKLKDNNKNSWKEIARENLISYIESNNNNKQLKQALQDIKDIAEAITNGTHFSDDVESHLKEMANKILEKINEVEDGNKILR